MKQVIREHLIDCSDQEKICFQPDLSGVRKSVAEYAGRLFQGGRRSPDRIQEGRLYLLYEREKKRAFDKAVEEAGHFFNLCPLCERLVCNNCFLICQEIDICRRCAERLQETGEQVSFAGWATHEDHCGEKTG